MPPVVAIGDPSPAEFSRVILETQHWKSTKLLCAVEVRDPRVPASYDKAIVIPLWAAAITTELGKFRDHNCLIMTPYTGQHLVPMKWGHKGHVPQLHKEAWCFSNVGSQG